MKVTFYKKCFERSLLGLWQKILTTPVLAIS